MEFEERQESEGTLEPDHSEEFMTEHTVELLISILGMNIRFLENRRSSGRIRKGDISHIVQAGAETFYEWRSWADKIPFLKFDPSWEIKICPPFGGVMCRFAIKNDYEQVSIFFDAYDCVGKVHCPYWEVYSSNRMDIHRFLFGDEEEMMEKIRWLMDKENEGKGDE